MATSIVIDTDPGRDDALAILLAAASLEVEVLGITTVAGNVGIDLTADNACRLADLAGLDVPISRGAAAPLWRRDTTSASHVHGENGLGGYQLPVTMVTLDVTLQARAFDEDLAPLDASAGPVADLVLALLRGDDGSEHTVADGGAPEHDSLAMAAVIDPSLVRLEPYVVDVENVGRLTSGMTVVDHRRRATS